MTTEGALVWIAICQTIFALAGLAAAIAIIYGIFAFKHLASSKIDDAMARIQPVVDQAKSVAEQARDTAERVSSKVDSIMEKAEITADRVGDRVQALSERVEEAVSPQVITAAGLVSAAVKFFQIYRDLNTRRPGPHDQASETEAHT